LKRQVGKSISLAIRGVIEERNTHHPVFYQRASRERPAERTIRMPKWWQPNSNGGCVKVGSKRIEFEKGKAAIAVGSLD
jgi:hypothetical protein